MTEPRLILMAKPGANERLLIEDVLDRNEIRGDYIVARPNLHQSLSGQHLDQPDVIQRLMRAGDRISAAAAPVTLQFNRMTRNGVGRFGAIWTLKTRGRPKAFDDLIDQVRLALLSEGRSDPTRNSPHMTISYGAPASSPTIAFAPIMWTIEEVLLVRGHGQPYRYDTLASWPLRGAPLSSSPQMKLSF